MPTDVRDFAAPPALSEDVEWARVRGVWAGLTAADLPREQYATAYRILHGSLYVGGFLCHIGVVGPELACCSHPGCEGALETLSHAFLLCPAVAPAAAWFCRISGRWLGSRRHPWALWKFWQRAGQAGLPRRGQRSCGSPCGRPSFTACGSCGTSGLSRGGPSLPPAYAQLQWRQSEPPSSATGPGPPSLW